MAKHNHILLANKKHFASKYFLLMAKQFTFVYKGYIAKALSSLHTTFQLLSKTKYLKVYELLGLS